MKHLDIQTFSIFAECRNSDLLEVSFPAIILD
jgi:hypothetical protein